MGRKGQTIVRGRSHGRDTHREIDTYILRDRLACAASRRGQSCHPHAQAYRSRTTSKLNSEAQQCSAAPNTPSWLWRRYRQVESVKVQATDPATATAHGPKTHDEGPVALESYVSRLLDLVSRERTLLFRARLVLARADEAKPEGCLINRVFPSPRVVVAVHRLMTAWHIGAENRKNKKNKTTDTHLLVSRERRKALVFFFPLGFRGGVGRGQASRGGSSIVMGARRTYGEHNFQFDGTTFIASRHKPSRGSA